MNARVEDPRPAATTPPTPRVVIPRRARWALGGAVAAIVVVVAAYWAGTVDGQAEARRTAAALAAQQKAGVAQHTGDRQALDVASARIDVLEARRLLHVAQLDVAEDNYGLARRHVHRAVGLLEKSASHDVARAVAKDAAGLNVSSTAASGAIAIGLEDLARRLDGVLNQPDATASL